MKFLSLVSASRRGSGIALSSGVGRRHGSDLAVLWLWCRSAAVAPIPPLVWELTYATGAALKIKKRGGSSFCGAIGGIMGCFFYPWPGTAGWDLALPQLQLQLKLWLRSDRWPGNSMCHGAAKKEKKWERNIIVFCSNRETVPPG